MLCFNIKSTTTNRHKRLALAKLKAMDETRCPLCRKPLPSDPRAKYCGEHHRWRAWWQRAIRHAAEVEQIPLATLPADADAVLPRGPDRLRVATRLVLLSRAPAGALGYRVGTRPLRSLILRWFPSARLSPSGLFRLDPFEWPAVPVPGTYAVVYMDRHFAPIGGPRFSIAVDDADPRLRISDGDRTHKPRPRP